MINTTINIDCSRDKGTFHHFWQSTGFSPAELLLTAEMRQMLAYVGSIPHKGIQHVRIHYLLNLLQVENLDTDHPVYHWELLDQGLDVLIQNRLKPFFELMGNPSNYFTDYTSDGQLHAWKRLVREVALRYIGRYGLAEVRSWYFETWNEPDIGFWKQGETAFFNYYDACSEGLKEADPELIFGGPGSANTLSPLFKSLMAHCDTGVNYFTGETGVRLDFISVHEKGARRSPEDLNPNTQAVCEREAHIVDYLRTHHSRFAAVPFMNNECDPQVGWQDVHTWHARPYYAAIACKMIDQHQKLLIEEKGCDYRILSNDHGFIGRWGNRTLLARFGGKSLPSGQAEHRTEISTANTEPPVEFIKKPIFNAMVMLSLLGNQQLSAEYNHDPGMGVIATRQDENQIAVLVYNSRDRIMSSGTTCVQLRLRGVPFERFTLVHYRIDETHGDPFAIWETMSDDMRASSQLNFAPELPTAEQYAQLRQHQELALYEAPREVETSDGELALDFDLPLHSVSLLLLCKQPEDRPETPEISRIDVYDGLTEQQNVLILWRGSESKFIQTYEVLFTPSLDQPFERLNPDTLCTAYLHAKTPGEGYYKVRTCDYWGRYSAESQMVAFISKS